MVWLSLITAETVVVFEVTAPCPIAADCPLTKWPARAPGLGGMNPKTMWEGNGLSMKLSKLNLQFGIPNGRLVSRMKKLNGFHKNTIIFVSCLALPKQKCFLVPLISSVAIAANCGNKPQNSLVPSCHEHCVCPITFKQDVKSR